MLRALPYHNAKQLVVVASTSSSGDRDGISVPELQDYQAQMRSLEDLTGFQSQSVNVTGGERPDRVRGAFVTANFFKVFNLPPLIGRTFVEGEDRQGGEKLAVVNEKMWQERLNSDRNLAAKKLILNGEPYSIIGVVSSSFKQPFDPDVEVWMPVANYPGNTGKREWRLLFGMGHLKQGVSVAQAQAEASTIASQLAQAYPKENAGRGARTELLSDILVRDVRPMLWLLFAAVGVNLSPARISQTSYWRVVSPDKKRLRCAPRWVPAGGGSFDSYLPRRQSSAYSAALVAYCWPIGVCMGC